MNPDFDNFLSVSTDALVEWWNEEGLKQARERFRVLRFLPAPVLSALFAWLAPILGRFVVELFSDFLMRRTRWDQAALVGEIYRDALPRTKVMSRRFDRQGN